MFGLDLREELILMLRQTITSKVGATIRLAYGQLHGEHRIPLMWWQVAHIMNREVTHTKLKLNKTEFRVETVEPLAALSIC